MARRGVRNNNPFNIKKTHTEWLGEVDGPDRVFKTFKTPEDGIRAGVVLLLNYEKKYGLNTIEGIIRRFAPPNENDTTAYINAVARSTRYHRDQPLDLRDFETMERLVKAIIKHENAGQPYSDAVIARGISRAGVRDIRSNLQRSRTVNYGRAAIGSTTLSAASDALQELHWQIAPLEDVLEWIKWISVGLAIASIGLMIWARIDDNRRELN